MVEKIGGIVGAEEWIEEWNGVEEDGCYWGRERRKLQLMNYLRANTTVTLICVGIWKNQSGTAILVTILVEFVFRQSNPDCMQQHH